MLLLVEFSDVVRRRRMVRNFAEEPVDPTVVQRALEHATRAPSAGFSQGWGFLVLDTPADVRRYWAAATDPDDLAAPGTWLRGMMRAPVLVLPCSSKATYLQRYAEDDKGWTDLDEGRWPVPYWHLDTAMATLLMLLTAVDEGLAACYFGVPGPALKPVRREFGIPDDHDPIGVVALGHRVPDTGSAGSPSRRRRRPVEEVAHRGRWGGGW